MMRAFFHSSRTFWSVSLVAAVIVLFMSVELGKVVGATILAKGAGERHSLPIVVTVSKGTPAVAGGQVHSAAALGDATARWVPVSGQRGLAASPSPSPTSSASPSPGPTGSPKATASPSATPTINPFTPNPTIAPASPAPPNSQL